MKTIGKVEGENGRAREEAVHFEEAIAIIGQGKFHYILQLICGCCLMSTIIEMLCTAYVLPAAQCDLHLTTQDMGIINAIAYVGMIFSSHLWGFLADTKGRRKILIFTLLMDSLCTIIESFTHAVWLLLVFRFFNGFFICGSAAVLFAYLGEFHSESTRARAIVWLGVFVAFGTISLPGLAWLIIPQDWSFELPWCTYHSWRLFLLICALPGLVTAIMLGTILPNSPKFMLVSGQEQEALKILRRMYATNTGNSPDKFPVKSIQMDTHPRRESILAHPPVSNTKSTLELLKTMVNQTLPLFRPPYLLNTILACILDFAIFSCANGFLLWLPEIFTRMSLYAGTDPDHGLTVCEVINSLVTGSGTNSTGSTNNTGLAHLLTNSTTEFSHGQSVPWHDKPDCKNEMDPWVFQNTLIIGGATTLAYILAGYLIPYVGKRNVLIVSMVTSGSAGIALYFMRTLNNVLALSCIFLGLATMCISVVNSIVVDLFPTQLRAMAVCLSLMFGRLGTVVGSLIVGLLLELNCASVFFVLSGIILGCGFLGFLIPRATKLIPLP